MVLNFFRLVPKTRTVKLNRRTGVLFSNPTGKKALIFYTGCLLVIFGVLYGIYLYQPLLSSLIRYKTSKPIVVSQQQVKKQIEKDQKTVVKDMRFLVNIPKIQASAEIEPNVLTQSKDDYSKVLAAGKIAHAFGSAFPGQGKNSYFFAHSTEQSTNMVRKNSVFYLLDYLVNGDDIFVRYDGKLRLYQVYDKKIVSAKDAQYLDYRNSENETIILQTCWPLGTNWKRLLIFAKKVE